MFHHQHRHTATELNNNLLLLLITTVYHVFYAPYTVFSAMLTVLVFSDPRRAGLGDWIKSGEGPSMAPGPRGEEVCL